MSEPDRGKVLQSLRELREGALGLVSGAEAEIAKVASRLLDRAGAPPGEEPPARVREAIHDLYERVRKNREVLEHRIDEALRGTVTRAGQPIADEVKALRARLESLSHRVDAFARRGKRPTDDKPAP